MVACGKKEQAMSEKSRKSFSSQHKAKVALEAIRGTKTVKRGAKGTFLITLPNNSSVLIN
jgi:hypothetical protein